MKKEGDIIRRKGHPEIVAQVVSPSADLGDPDAKAGRIKVELLGLDDTGEPIHNRPASSQYWTEAAWWEPWERAQ